MQKIIDLLVNGECFTIENSIKCSVNKISAELKKNKLYQDSIIISNENNQIIEANIYSDNIRLKLDTNYFNDKTQKVSFIVDTMYLSNGDEISGEISVLSDVSEFLIPFKYTIVDDEVDNSILNIKSIIDFYDLTIRDYEKAFEIFNSDIFLKTGLMEDVFYRSIYDSLIIGVTKEIAFVEFFKAGNLDVLEYVTNKSVIKEIYEESRDISDLSFETLSVDSGDEIDTKDDDIINLISQIQDKDLIDTLAINCVRNNLRDNIAFNIYIKSIQGNSIINGLYEILLASIPERYTKKLPLYLYKLYYTDKSFSFEQKINLYKNIITVFQETDDIYKMFNVEIREYVLTQIYQNKINDSLIKIYNNILTKSVIDDNNNKNILYLLRCHKIVIKNKSIKSVIIKYKEINNETIYSVINNIAYVPIFFDTYILLFEDIYGNRYFNQDIVINKLFDKTDLEIYCLENYPNDEILNISKIISFIDSGEFKYTYDVELAKRFIYELNLNTAVKKELTLQIIDYYSKIISTNYIDVDVEYLKKVDLLCLSNKYKSKVLRLLYEKEDYLNCFNILSKLNDDLLEDNELLSLYTIIIKKDIGVDKNVLTTKVFDLFNKGVYDINTIDYLIDKYVGKIESLIKILRVARELNINTDIYTYNLLKLMLSINYTGDLDYVYSLFTPEKFEYEDINLNIAYITRKCIDYFLYDIEFSNVIILQITNYLLYNINDLNNCPVLYLLAYTKYISKLETINDNDMRRVLIRAIDVLINKDFVFAYFKDLNKHIKMPYEIMNKEFIEYHAKNNELPKVIFTINGKHKLKDFELANIYMNIFLKKITVYKDEIITYEIYNILNKEQGVLQKGVLKYSDIFELEYSNMKSKDSFTYINLALENIEKNNMDVLKHIVLEMVTKQEVSKNLFEIDG